MPSSVQLGTIVKHFDSRPTRERQVTVDPLKPVLEQLARTFADGNSEPPFLYQLSPEEGRKIAISVQTDPPFNIRRRCIRLEH